MKTNKQPQGQTQEPEQEQAQEVKRTYKDSVFVTIFHEKAKLIELYNALFDTNYDESAPIDIVTIKGFLSWGEAKRRRRCFTTHRQGV